VKPILHPLACFLFVYPWSPYCTCSHVSCSYIREAHVTHTGMLLVRISVTSKSVTHIQNYFRLHI
jgi:hypothetical protein